jgi:serine/threonine-protein kinase
LIDFGIAKAANRSAHTQVGFVKGKLGYMAPEQLRGQAVDARTDVFALGIVLYELTTMRRAFREDSDRATAEKIKSAAFTPPSAIVPGYPVELERIVKQALAVEPRDRYPDADKMRREIEALGHRLELLLGDAAVTEIMVQLFEEHREPWQPRKGGDSDINNKTPTAERAETETETSVHVASRDDTKPSRFPNRRAGELRTATEAVDQLIVDLDTPVRGTPLVTAVPIAVTSPDTDAITAINQSLPPPPPPGIPPTPTPTVPQAQGLPVTPIPINPSAMARPPSARPAMPAAPKQSPKRGWIAAGAVGVLAVVAMVSSFFEDRSAPVSSPEDAMVIVSIDAPAVDAPPPPVAIDAAIASPGSAGAHSTAGGSAESIDAPLPATVRLAIKTTPADAAITLDGKKLGKTPYDNVVDAKYGKAALQIKKRGYAVVNLEVSLEGDVQKDITLVRE